MNIRTSLKSPNTGPVEVPSTTGKYVGTFQRQESDSLVRLSDGLHLQIRQRSGPIGPHSSALYLVDITANSYLSNLYENQFDDRIHRYKIELLDEEKKTYQITVLRLAGNGTKKGGVHDD